jgi:hypothetical protein
LVILFDCLLLKQYIATLAVAGLSLFLRTRKISWTSAPTPLYDE